ncbi:MAG: winged helix-turn-helix transcriptional regulator [Acidimicrobiaceae bacterium]|nr:winged helix-turn-helix transcriptional regulator [Acidimicrobiaceae bacterium]
MSSRSLTLIDTPASRLDCSPQPRRVPLDVARAEHWAHLFALLADPVRLRLLSALCEAPEPVCACDLVQPLERSQPTVSHHLKVLTEAGMVSGERRGRWILYSSTHAGERAYALVQTLEPLALDR